jgi:hypothetical protein
MASNPTEVVGLVLGLAYRQLDAQVSSSDNYDTKAAGVLGFDGAALAAVLVVKDAFHGGWWIPALAIVVSIAYAFVAIQSGNYDFGPTVKSFYDKVRQSNAVEANVVLIAEMDGAIQANQSALRAKAHYFLGSLVATTVAAITSAILLWLVA